MRIDRLGETAAILRDLGEDAAAVADVFPRVPGLVEAVACYDTVGIYFEDAESLSAAIADGLSIAMPTAAPPFRTHEVPVCYELGEDLEEVAKTLELAQEEVVALHTGTTYRCYAVGFCPGFPYLGPLPDRLAGIPRRATPRPRIEPGSVAITGWQTGVYPLVRPGGWAILGRTPLVLVHEEDDYFPIRAGDRVTFRAIDRDEFAARQGERL